MRVLITGGCGFVGSNLAHLLARDEPDWRIVAFDNLHRRGSELAPARLEAAGVRFVEGDVRFPDEIEAAGPFDLLIECSAEPSVHAGYGGGLGYLIDTNLMGAVHCLEAARRNGAGLVFLSSSRVYPIAALNALPLERRETRLDLPAGAAGPGWSAAGIGEGFALAGARSFYGATKLSAELLVAEYAEAFGLKAIVDRCGVIAGPWQMGKVDQGVVALWAARHLFGGRLDYIGYGGEGLQVRDVLHVADLHDLLRLQIARIDDFSGKVFNVGGGRANSLSLRELTARCASRAGRRIDIGAIAETRGPDVPWYVTDNAAIEAATGWRPRRSLDALLDEVFDWLRGNRSQLEGLFAP